MRTQPATARLSHALVDEEEDTCMSYEEEDTCMSYEEDTYQPLLVSHMHWSLVDRLLLLLRPSRPALPLSLPPPLALALALALALPPNPPGLRVTAADSAATPEARAGRTVFRQTRADTEGIRYDLLLEKGRVRPGRLANPRKLRKEAFQDGQSFTPLKRNPEVCVCVCVCVCIVS